MEAHVEVSMQVPSTPLTSHDGGGGEPLLLELELELLELLEPELLELELLELELLELELLELEEPEPSGVQHSMLAAPEQCPAVETWPVIAAQALVAMQTPSTPETEQLVEAEEEPPKSASAAWAWARRWEESQAPQTS